MSEAASHPQGQSPAPVLAIVVVVAIALVLGAFLLGQGRTPPIAKSAIGHTGLITWLRSGDLEVRRNAGIITEQDAIGLRILPLYDTDLETLFEKPETEEAFLATTTERDLTERVVRAKLDNLPTLVVAPKWTRAMRHSGYAHGTLLTPIQEASRPFRQLGFMNRNFVRPGARKMTLRGEPEYLNRQIATLYEPQLFAPELDRNCVSLIGDRLGHLLIRCKGETRSFHALSDPDLLNNHGLSIGENAAFTTALIGELSREKPVLLDSSTSVLVRDVFSYPRRNWSDLLRFFHYPFLLIWLGLAILSVFALWRSGVRFGPPKKFFDDRVGASKSVSIAAKARLLRLSGNDNGLIEAHVRNRLQALASEVIGPGVKPADPLEQVVRLVKRRNPELAAGLSAASARALTQPWNTTPGRLLDLLDEFETFVEKVLHEFGRTPGRR